MPDVIEEPAAGGGAGLNLKLLKEKKIHELAAIAKEFDIEGGFEFAEAGADLLHPPGADGAERLHLRRRRARDPARRLRFPARARLQLPAGSRRHLRLAEPDPPLQPAHRRRRLRTDPPAEGGRALLRAAQGRGDQLRGAGEGARQDPLRQPDAALPARAAASRARSRGVHHAHDRSAHADRQGPARPDRGGAAHRQDDDAAEHRPRHHRQSQGRRS